MISELLERTLDDKKGLSFFHQKNILFDKRIEEYINMALGANTLAT